MDFLLLAGGIGLLYLGGERLIGDASHLARAFGMSPLLVGLTVVAFATSMPELAATLAAVLADEPAVAVGNVVGSNIVNLGLVLGVAAVIAPLSTTARFLRREVPFMLGASAAMVAVLGNGVLSRIEAALLLVGMAVFLGALLRGRPSESEPIEREFAEEYVPTRRPWVSALGILLGVALLVVGARGLVTGAVGLARAIGVSERVIGLTAVALGTSLPELAASLVAAARRAPDIVLGNLIGSNVFNLLFILPVAALVRPPLVDAAPLRIDLAVMIAFALVTWPFLWSARTLGRVEGALLAAGYAAYVGWLFL